MAEYRGVFADFRRLARCIAPGPRSHALLFLPARTTDCAPATVNLWRRVVYSLRSPGVGRAAARASAKAFAAFRISALQLAAVSRLAREATVTSS
jgi:hypothetical protein